MHPLILITLFQLAQGQLQTIVGPNLPGNNLDASLIIYLEPDSALSVDGALIWSWKNLAAPPSDTFHSFAGIGTSPPIFVRKGEGVPWIALELARGNAFGITMAGDFDDYLTFLTDFTLHMVLYTVLCTPNEILFEIEENPFVPGSRVLIRRQGDTNDLLIVVGRASFTLEKFFTADSARILGVRMSATSKTLNVYNNGMLFKQFSNVDSLPTVVRYKLSIGQNSNHLFGTITLHNRALTLSEMSSIGTYLLSKYVSPYAPATNALLGPSVDFNQVLRAHTSVQSLSLVGMDFSNSLVMYLSTASLPLSPLVRWPNHANSTWALFGRGLSMEFPSVNNVGLNKMVELKRNRAQYFRILPPDVETLTVWTGFSFSFVASVRSEAGVDGIFGERILELKNHNSNLGTISVGRYNDTRGYGLTLPGGRWTGDSWNSKMTAIYTVNVIGANVTFWRNGLLTSTITGTAAVPLSFRRYTQNFLGFGSTGASFDGMIGDVLLYNRGLSNGELIAVHTYLGSVYNTIGNPLSTRIRFVELIPPRISDICTSIVVSSMTAINGAASIVSLQDIRNQSLSPIRATYQTNILVSFPVEVDATDGLKLQLESVFITETTVLMYDGLGRLIRKATLSLGTRFLGRTIFSFNIFFSASLSTASHSTPPEAPAMPFISSLHSQFDAGSWSASLNLWLDRSGNGRHATVPVGLLSPTVFNLGGSFSPGSDSYAVLGGALGGGPNQGIRFLTNNLPVGYTLLTRARYIGGLKNRIFDAVEYRFFHSFSGGYSGITLHYDTWLTDTGGSYGDEWVVGVDTWDGTLYIRLRQIDEGIFHLHQIGLVYRGNGMTSTFTPGPRPAGSLTLTINNGMYSFSPADRTDWLISDFVVFDREMNIAEMVKLEAWMATKSQRWGGWGTRQPGPSTDRQTRFIRLYSSTRKALFLGELEVVTTGGQQVRQNTTTVVMSNFFFSAINSPNMCLDKNYATFSIIPANPLQTEYMLFDLGASFDVANITLYPPLSNLMGLMESPIVQTIAVDGTLLSTSTLPTTQACSSIAIMFPFIPNGVLVPITVPDLSLANTLIRYIVIRGSDFLNFENVNVFAVDRLKVNVVDAMFNSLLVGATDVKPMIAQNCVRNFFDGGCSSDLVAGSQAIMIMDLGRPVAVTQVEILNRRDFFESRLATGNAQVDFFNVFGTKLSTGSAALISYNVTVNVPGTSQLSGTGIRFFRIVGRANVGVALAEFSVLTFEGRPLRIASVTKSSMAVSGGQSWNCVDGDVMTDCFTASGAVESILFDMGALLPPATIQKIVVVNRVGAGARDTLAGQPLQFLAFNMAIISTFTFPADTRDQYQFPGACDFGTFLGFTDCFNCPEGTYKDQVSDASSCTACPVQNGIQTVTIRAGSKSLSSCVCPGGYAATTPGTCLACAVNTFRDVSNALSSCTACPPGSSTGNKTAQALCNFCAAGFLGNLGSISCRPCTNCNLPMSANSPPSVLDAITKSYATTSSSTFISIIITATSTFPPATASESSPISTSFIVAIGVGCLGCVLFVSGILTYVLRSRRSANAAKVQFKPLSSRPNLLPMGMNNVGWDQNPQMMTNQLLTANRFSQMHLSNSSLTGPQFNSMSAKINGGMTNNVFNSGMANNMTFNSLLRPTLLNQSNETNGLYGTSMSQSFAPISQSGQLPITRSGTLYQTATLNFPSAMKNKSTLNFSPTNQ